MLEPKEGIRETLNNPWYKEPWAWLLMCGPFIVVIAGFVTFYIAADTQDSLVTDDYYKEGKYIHLLIERDQMALQKKLTGQAYFNKNGSEVRVAMQGDLPVNTPITLYINHPTFASQDQMIKLNSIGGNMYQASLKPLRASKYWHIQIEDDAKTWRIQERWYPEQNNEIKLTSALEQVNK